MFSEQLKLSSFLVPNQEFYLWLLIFKREKFNKYKNSFLPFIQDLCKAAAQGTRPTVGESAVQPVYAVLTYAFIINLKNIKWNAHLLCAPCGE